MNLNTYLLLYLRHFKIEYNLYVWPLNISLDEIKDLK